MTDKEFIQRRKNNSPLANALAEALGGLKIEAAIQKTREKKRGKRLRNTQESAQAASSAQG